MLEKIVDQLQTVRCVPHAPWAAVTREHVEEVIVQQLPHTLHLLWHAVPVVVSAVRTLLTEQRKPEDG